MDNVLLPLALDLNPFEILPKTQRASIHIATLAKRNKCETNTATTYLARSQCYGCCRKVWHGPFQANEVRKSIHYPERSLWCYIFVRTLFTISSSFERYHARLEEDGRGAMEHTNRQQALSPQLITGRYLY